MVVQECVNTGYGLLRGRETGFPGGPVGGVKMDPVQDRDGHGIAKKLSRSCGKGGKGKAGL